MVGLFVCARDGPLLCFVFFGQWYCPDYLCLHLSLRLMLD